MAELPKFANLRDGYEPEDTERGSAVIAWVILAASVVGAGSLLAGLLILLDPAGLL
jgi:hypothetical protein